MYVHKKTFTVRTIPAILPSILMVTALADEESMQDFQNFQSIASMCLTTDCFPWFAGDITYPPPVKAWTSCFYVSFFQMSIPRKLIVLYGNQFCTCVAHVLMIQTVNLMVPLRTNQKVEQIRIPRICGHWTTNKWLRREWRKKQVKEKINEWMIRKPSFMEGPIS